MAEYITKAQAIDLAESMRNLMAKGVADAFIKGIEQMEVADTAKYGYWLKSEDDYFGLNIVQCSLCKEEWCFEIDDDVKDLNYRHCPNCGAKMITPKEKGQG